MEKRPYYITTAITYTSGKPHIGNTYEIVLTDAIARFRRNQGYDVRFQTSTAKRSKKRPRPPARRPSSSSTALQTRSRASGT